MRVKKLQTVVVMEVSAASARTAWYRWICCWDRTARQNWLNLMEWTVAWAPVVMVDMVVLEAWVAWASLAWPWWEGA
jgi:hypothetical protein